MKNKKKLIIIGIAFLVLIILIVTTNIAHNAYTKEEKTEEVYVEQGRLITRTNTYEWSKPEPKEKTCEYYTLMTEKLNALQGITGTIYCNDAKTSGNAKIIYTIQDVNREDVKLKQFDFLDKDNIFNVSAWKYYMENNKYKCTMK